MDDLRFVSHKSEGRTLKPHCGGTGLTQTPCNQPAITVLTYAQPHCNLCVVLLGRLVPDNGLVCFGHAGQVLNL